MDNSTLERQENEVIVLKSIYSNYFVDLKEEQIKQLSNNKNNQVREKKSNAAVPVDNLPLFKIILFPASSQSQDLLREPFVQISLRVKITPNYPNELPRIFLENEKGLTADLIKTLFRQLILKATNLKGKEMIFDLCQDIQEFLYIHNKPPTVIKSFYEQRLESQQIQEKQHEEQEMFCDAKKQIEDQLLLEIEQANELKRQVLQQERKKEKQMEIRERLLSNSSPPTRTRAISKTSENESVDAVSQLVIKEKETQFVSNFHPFIAEFSEPNFYKINCIKLLKHDSENSLTLYRGIDINSNEIYNVYECRISLEKNRIIEKKKLEQCETEMRKIEEEFKNLNKLNHKLLVKYLALKYFKETDKNVFVIQLCLEYVEGNTMEFLLNTTKQSYVILESTLQMFISQLLDAVEYLHSHHIIHRDIKPSCIYIVNNYSYLSLKLSDYSIIKKLNNLNEIVSNDATNIVQGAAKSDIHQLGLLILSLSLGEKIKDYYPQVPSTLPPELKSFINMCLKQLDKVDCKYLRNHPFMLKNTNTNEKINTLANSKRTISLHYDEDDDDCLRQFTDYPMQSRLATEFEVIGVIGQGGFGEVLKVKNKLDSRFYAIKRIRINPTNKQFNKLITREIKLLSRLNHENVVRYYSTWIESYDEVNTEGKSPLEKQRSKSSHSQSYETDQSHSPKSLVRFQVNDRTISHDESDESESEAGCIAWCRKQTPNDDEDFSSLDSLDDYLSSSEEDSDSNQSDSSSSPLGPLSASSSSAPSLSASPAAATVPVLVSGQKNKITKSLLPIHKLKSKEANVADTDDSVIFAENDDEASNKKSKKIMSDDEDIASEEEIGQNPTSTLSSSSGGKKRHFIYIQMEFCGGKTLKDLIEKGLCQNEEKVWCLFREILQGLHHIHEQGMIHRDLKPGNVLIDSGGHAKIGDFGLATSKSHLHPKNSATATGSISNTASLPSASNPISISNSNSGGGGGGSGGGGFLTVPDSSADNNYDSHQGADSTSAMSGAIGTPSYTAPELLQQCAKNKYSYSQKVDIYSLGIMLYEMFFPFNTAMERYQVIQRLRQPEVLIASNIETVPAYQSRLSLIRSMLNHDAKQRPSTSELLHSELIPRKADEIAFDELLSYSMDHKQSTTYKKIVKALFDQRNSEIDDASFDTPNCKPPSSMRTLQIRDHVYNTLIRLFQRHGGYMIAYPLLMPVSDLVTKFEKTYKLTDASGLVVSLPYNHRMPFARYIARSGCTNIKRYYIGTVYSEKSKLTSLHPREHTEASFDIVTSSKATDCLPEMELLALVTDVLSSFNELNNMPPGEPQQHYMFVFNHASILGAIFIYCGLSVEQQRKIFPILAEYNNKQIKMKDHRTSWLKENLKAYVGLNEATVEKLFNFLLKHGEPEKVLSELRSLTKNETSQFSKLAKEALNQLKIIVACMQIVDATKIPIVLSCSYVLPMISLPYEYNGFLFQLLVRSKHNKHEYDILASGGRYDKLIAQLRTKNLVSQYACGMSIDFDRIAYLIGEKDKVKQLGTVYRQELAVCSIGTDLNTNPLVSSATMLNSSSITSRASSTNLKQIITSVAKAVTTNADQTNAVNVNSLIIQEIKNRLRLFTHLSSLNRPFNVCTHLIHEKFQSQQDADDYCRKNSISSFVFIKESSTTSTSQVFLSNQPNSDSTFSSNAHINNMSTVASNANSAANQSFVKFRSLIEKGYKLIEKKFNLNDFLNFSNIIINNITSVHSVSSPASFLSTSFFTSSNILNSTQSFMLPSSSSSSTLSNLFNNLSLTNSMSSSNLNQNSNSNVNNSNTYSDFVNSLLNTASIVSTNSLSMPSMPQSASGISSSNSTTAMPNNVMSQLNITILLEPSSKQQSTSGSTRKKLEQQLVAKLTHIFSLFSSRTRIELIAIETPDNVIQTLANGLHLEMEEQYFNANWMVCLEKLNNSKYKKQLCNFKLDEILHDLRYFKKSKVFILYSLKSDQFKLVVAP